jgi:hypothetical protein
MVLFKTIHHDGTINTAPPSATSHHAILKTCGPNACLVRRAWRHRQVARIHTRVSRVLCMCELFHLGQQGQGDVGLPFGSEVVCAADASPGRGGAGDWCHSMDVAECSVAGSGRNRSRDGVCSRLCQHPMLRTKWRRSRHTRLSTPCEDERSEVVTPGYLRLAQEVVCAPLWRQSGKRRKLW